MAVPPVRHSSKVAAREEIPAFAPLRPLVPFTPAAPAGPMRAVGVLHAVSGIAMMVSNIEIFIELPFVLSCFI